MPYFSFIIEQKNKCVCPLETFLNDITQLGGCGGGGVPTFVMYLRPLPGQVNSHLARPIKRGLTLLRYASCVPLPSVFTIAFQVSVVTIALQVSVP